MFRRFVRRLVAVALVLVAATPFASHAALPVSVDGQPLPSLAPL